MFLRERAARATGRRVRRGMDGKASGSLAVERSMRQGWARDGPGTRNGSDSRCPRCPMGRSTAITWAAIDLPTIGQAPPLELSFRLHPPPITSQSPLSQRNGQGSCPRCRRLVFVYPRIFTLWLIGRDQAVLASPCPSFSRTTRSSLRHALQL